MKNNSLHRLLGSYPQSNPMLSVVRFSVDSARCRIRDRGLAWRGDRSRIFHKSRVGFFAATELDAANKSVAVQKCPLETSMEPSRRRIRLSSHDEALDCPPIQNPMPHPANPHTAETIIVISERFGSVGEMVKTLSAPARPPNPHFYLSNRRC
jgi:hypothetical protein